MFDRLFKRTRTKKYTFEPIDDEIMKLCRKIDSVKSSCLDDDKKIIEPLKKRISELRAVRRLRQKAIVNKLNTFPLHTPCTLTHLSDALNIDYQALHEVMYSRKHRFRPRICRSHSQYVLSIDGWQEVKYDHRTYLERTE